MPLALLSGVSLVVRRSNCVETMFEPIKHSFHPAFSCNWQDDVASAVASPLTRFLGWFGAFSATALTLDPDVGQRASSPQESGHAPRANTVVCERARDFLRPRLVRDFKLADFFFRKDSHDGDKYEGRYDYEEVDTIMITGMAEKNGTTRAKSK